MQHLSKTAGEGDGHDDFLFWVSAVSGSSEAEAGLYHTCKLRLEGVLDLC